MTESKTNRTPRHALGCRRGLLAAGAVTTDVSGNGYEVTVMKNPQR